MNPAPILAMDALQTVVLIGGLSLVIVMLLWNAHRKRRAGAAATAGARIGDFIRGRQDESALKDDMQRLLAELLQATREIEAQLETKFQKLDVLIAEADQRIEQLQRLAEANGEPTDRPAPKSAKRTSREEAAGSGGPAAADHQRVYALADKGKTPPQIAVALGKTIGEIELILALRNKGG